MTETDYASVGSRSGPQSRDTRSRSKFMSESDPSSAPTRGRGRGKSRGGLGKYLRARGGRRGGGRPATFSERLVLEGEQEVELDEEETKELEVSCSDLSSQISE